MRSEAVLFAENRPFILLGAGGHAKVLLSVIKTTLPRAQIKICAPEFENSSGLLWRDHIILGSDEALSSFSVTDYYLVNGVGPSVTSNLRERVFKTNLQRGCTFPPLVHASAIVDESVILNEDVQIFANAVVQADSHIGSGSVINTCASVDHDCTVGDYVHLAPGAILCGGVTVGSRCFIGAGAVIGPNVCVGENSVVGAGAVIVRSLASNSKVLPSAMRKF